MPTAKKTMTMLSGAPAKLEKDEQQLAAFKASLKMEKANLRTAKKGLTAEQWKLVKCLSKKDSLTKNVRTAKKTVTAQERKVAECLRKHETLTNEVRKSIRKKESLANAEV